MAGEQRRRRLRALLRKAEAAGDDLSLFEQAFVHQSAARERAKDSNERLEFLGDSVLGNIAANWLFEHYPGEGEGWLTRRKAAIVSDRALARTALRLGFPDLLELGEGMTRADGAHNNTILADAFEAFVGALSLHSGEAAARRFVLEQHVANIDLSEESVTDSKTRLQHLSQERFRQVPLYRAQSIGTAQAPRFACEVILQDKVMGSGSGKSKKEAQLEAAGAALQALLAPPRRRKKAAQK